VISHADQAEVEQFLRQYGDAFNRQDIESVAGMWSENAVHVDLQTGEQTEGREAIKSDLADVFDAPAKTRIAGTVESVRAVSADVVHVRGEVLIAIPDQDPSTVRFSGILVKRDGHWQIDSIEESDPTPPPSSRDALSELEWFVGDWLDESDGTRVISTVRWSDNETFLIRTIVEQTADGEVSRAGTQVIGWDPRGQQIRSWSFNADGSFGDGVWSKNGDDWYIKSSQTLAGGESASGTYVISPLDDDTIRMRLIGHEVEGAPVAESEPVTIVRLPANQAETAGEDTAQPVPSAPPSAN
jgi:uncharacterized protein (TIGR02246 family)